MVLRENPKAIASSSTLFSKHVSATAQAQEMPGSGERLFSVKDARYLASHSEKDIAFVGEDLSLVTVFNVPEGPDIKITESWIRDIVKHYEDSDDVFQTAFLSGVILYGAEKNDVEITPSALQFLKAKGTTTIRCMSTASAKGSLSPGPYVVVEGHLREVWRLFDDTNGTFMTTLRPQKGPFVELRLKSTNDVFQYAALPSRIKSQTGSPSIFAGLRVAVKDNYHLKGIRTSLGNRAFYETYPPRPETAECVQKLIGLGAVIVGKTKMNSLGNWEEPTEYIDYQAPWNPRADRYQSPGGSSTGSASAIGEYDWLDIALGSDTWGSIMRPGLWCGCFALRPTFGAVLRKGLEPCIDYLDMPAFLGRDLRKCIDFAAAWLETDSLTEDPKPFSAIMWATDFWKTIDSKQCEIARAFVKDLESHLGMKHSEVSFEEEWSKSPPPEADGLPLMEFIVQATNDILYDGYHSLDDFRAKHQQKFGVPPYVSPPNRTFWESAKSITKAERDKGVKRVDVYRRWFGEKVIAAESSHVLLVLPIENLSPRYRDEPPAFERPPPGVNSLFLSPVMKAPELIIPIGEIPYMSKITQREEKLPFAVGLMSLPGSDLMLMDVTYDILKKAGRPTSVHTGRFCWERENV